jgi:hypothetical protein
MRAGVERHLQCRWEQGVICNCVVGGIQKYKKKNANRLPNKRPSAGILPDATGGVPDRFFYAQALYECSERNCKWRSTATASL